MVSGKVCKKYCVASTQPSFLPYRLRGNKGLALVPNGQTMHTRTELGHVLEGLHFHTGWWYFVCWTEKKEISVEFDDYYRDEWSIVCNALRVNTEEEVKLYLSRNMRDYICSFEGEMDSFLKGVASRIGLNVGSEGGVHKSWGRIRMKIDLFMFLTQNQFPYMA